MGANSGKALAGRFATILIERLMRTQTLALTQLQPGHVYRAMSMHAVVVYMLNRWCRTLRNVNWMNGAGLGFVLRFTGHSHSCH